MQRSLMPILLTTSTTETETHSPRHITSKTFNLTGNDEPPSAPSILIFITNFYNVYHIETEFSKEGLMTGHGHQNFNHGGHSGGLVALSIC